MVTRYVVEKILSHMINNEGEPLFEVKWEGYEKKSDRTWEPEENLRYAPTPAALDALRHALTCGPVERTRP